MKLTISAVALFFVLQTPIQSQTWQEMLNERPVLKELAVCESGINPQAINPHDGGSPSFGLFQYKLDTFYRYNLKYKIYPNIEEAEIENIIFEPKGQILLAEKMLNDGEWRNWYTCLKGRFL